MKTESRHTLRSGEFKDEAESFGPMNKSLIISIFAMSLAGFIWAIGFPEFHTKQLAYRSAENAIKREIDASSATAEEKYALAETVAWSFDTLGRQRSEEGEISNRRILVSFSLLIFVTCLCTLLLREKKAT